MAKTDSIKKFKFVFYIVSFLLLLSMAALAYIGAHELKKIKRKTRSHSRFLFNVSEGFRRTLPRLGSVILPMQLQNIPLGESMGVVLDTKEVEIRNVYAPYNPSMVAKGDGNFWVFFRYDVIDSDCPRDFYTNVGVAELDSNFEQTDKEFQRIDLQSDFAEDPRVTWLGDKLFMTFNMPVSLTSDRRSMHVAQLDTKTLDPIYITPMDLQLQHMEKNWVPFGYKNADENYQLMYEYHLYPHTLFRLEDPRQGGIEHVIYPNTSNFPKPSWPKQWGALRGGTPAIEVDEQYIALFHSMFQDIDGQAWYIMGGYTFENEPPFHMTSVSNYPIFYDGIFSAPARNTAPKTSRITYPAGLVSGKKDGRDVLFVSCGENDSSIKIITLDKEAFLKSLKPIKRKK